ncbi:Putative ubiquitin thioesterase L96, partial [Durusdinium trenchii]
MGGSPEKAAKPPPKKRAVVRDAPKGLTRVPNSAQGNCLFESIAQGLNPDNPKHARAIRAAVIAHLKRHADRYQPWWDNLRPDEEICDSWEEYLRLVSKAGAYAGCLEIAYNQSSKKGCICLWFQDQHYEYLKGDLNPELGS